MRNCLFLATVVLAFSCGAVHAQTKSVNCRFSTDRFEPYTCYITNLDLNAGDSIAISGSHLLGRTNDDVQIVRFESSKLHRVPQEIFDVFRNMDRLVVLNSDLQTLIPLRNCNALFNVNIQHTNLRVVPPNVFRECRRLNVLLLENNQITEFNSDGLDNLPNLYLARNRLNTITAGTFNNLRQVRIFSLDWNNLTVINPDHFRLPNVETFNLIGNGVTELAANTFANIPRVQRVFLAQNQINKIDPTAFHRIPSLRGLYLNGNRISNIDNMFTRNSDLEVIQMNQNQIRRLNHNTFSFLHRLLSLELTNNQIEVIERGVLDGVSAFARIALNGNVCINEAGTRVELQGALQRCLP